MGLLKKIFRPVAKVLDKVIPNEIKPALPYLAAFAPVFGPAGMQSFIGSTMGRRALTSGLMNIGAQLAQEGNEGDINLLSAGLGALSGAMTTPGAAGDFRAMQSANKLQDANVTRTALQKAGDFGLEGLAKGSEFLRPGGEIPNLFSKEGLKIATAPAAQATGDVMQAEARQLEKQAAIDAALAEAEALADSGLRGDAIRNAMRAYGFFTDDEIEETVSSAGYRAGGRVGFEMGGLGAMARGMQQLRGKSSDLDLMTIKATLNQVYTNNDDGEGGGMAAVMEFMENNPEYKVQVMENIIGEQGDIIRVAPIEETPINILDNMDGSGMSLNDGILIIDSGMFEKKAKGGRVGFRFGGIDKAIEGVSEEIQEEGKEGIMMAAKEDPLLIEEYNKYVFDLLEQRPNAKPMSFSDFKRMIKSGMKDGGIMKAKRGLVNEPGGYAGEMAPPLDNKIEGFSKKMVDEFLQGNLPEFKGERVSDYYNKPNFTDVNAVLKIIEMGGSFDDVRNVLNIDITDERIKDFIRFDQEDRARKEGSMKDGGLMNLGGKEMDLRGGGFVPIGKKERADDVPARLSKNEFVMTADAVRAAGGGSINEGAKRMYKVMNDLEARA